jgi:hypothetical protein
MQIALTVPDRPTGELGFWASMVDVLARVVRGGLPSDEEERRPHLAAFARTRVGAHDATPTPKRLVYSEDDEVELLEDVEGANEEEGGEEERRRAGVAVAPSDARSSIGTLKHQISTTFGLDVVLCRKGDRDLRALKCSVRMSRYQVEG